MKKTIAEIEKSLGELRTIKEKMDKNDEEFYVHYSDFCIKLKEIPHRFYTACCFSLYLPEYGNVFFSKPKVASIDNTFEVLKMKAVESEKARTKTIQVCAYPENDEIGNRRTAVGLECVNNILGTAEAAFYRYKEQAKKDSWLKEIKKYFN